MVSTTPRIEPTASSAAVSARAESVFGTAAPSHASPTRNSARAGNDVQGDVREVEE